MPSSRHATMTRSAISPRLAIRIFLNMLRRLDGKQPLPILHRLPVLDVALDDLAVAFRVDLVHQLHRLDDAQHLAFTHHVANFRERFRPGLRCTVERPDDRRLHDGEIERLALSYKT